MRRRQELRNLTEQGHGLIVGYLRHISTCPWVALIVYLFKASGYSSIALSYPEKRQGTAHCSMNFPGMSGMGQFAGVTSLLDLFPENFQLPGATEQRLNINCCHLTFHQCPEPCC